MTNSNYCDNIKIIKFIFLSYLKHASVKLYNDLESGQNDIANRRLAVSRRCPPGQPDRRA